MSAYGSKTDQWRPVTSGNDRNGHSHLPNTVTLWFNIPCNVKLAVILAADVLHVGPRPGFGAFRGDRHDRTRTETSILYARAGRSQHQPDVAARSNCRSGSGATGIRARPRWRRPSR